VVPGPFGSIARTGQVLRSGVRYRTFGVVQAGSMRIGQVTGSRDFLLPPRSALHIALFFLGSLPRIDGRGLGRAAPWTLSL
jgi:hypothetical protein